MACTCLATRTHSSQPSHRTHKLRFHARPTLAVSKAHGPKHHPLQGYDNGDPLIPQSRLVSVVTTRCPRADQPIGTRLVGLQPPSPVHIRALPRPHIPSQAHQHHQHQQTSPAYADTTANQLPGPAFRHSGYQAVHPTHSGMSSRMSMMRQSVVSISTRSVPVRVDWRPLSFIHAANSGVG